MIYLGDQKTALNIYSKEAICWLNIKLLGKLKPSGIGYKCPNINCNICNKDLRKNTAINNVFRGLFNSQIIQDIVQSKPSQLLALKVSLNAQYIPPTPNDNDSFDEQCKKLFVTSGYLGWFQKKDENTSELKWNYRLAQLLDKHTCTYCNREYIFVYENKNGGKGMVPQFDHWFAKTDYPLFALSFYNLIPSCGTCNGIKSDVEMNLTDHLHPYVDPNISDSYRFSYFLDSINSLKVVLKNNSSFSSKPEKTFETLNLEMIYKGHSNKELKDLHELRYKYSENYLKILLENTFGNLPMTEQEKYRLIFGIELDDDNYHKRIMSKFKKDIITELLNNT